MFEQFACIVVASLDILAKQSAVFVRSLSFVICSQRRHNLISDVSIIFWM